MTSRSTNQRLWFYRGLTLLVTALLAHLLTIWAVPRLIMRVVLQGSAAQSLNMHNQAAFPPPVTAQSRAIVMPSPDLLYSVCVYDLSEGAVRVQAAPQLPNYWSIALYSANSDNFFVRNDRQAAGKPVDLWLVPSSGAPAQNQVPASAEVVVSPSKTGFLLMRVLASDYQTDQAVLEAGRRTLRCQAAGTL
jgi:uncharacterized membrane protein